ncbi:MAG TPA: cation transporter [Candidatus Polarisedimenticolaceae bacterium]|nr:cation transporter [Candidatus Polarisedimenticolaceae bacterium]
MANRAALISRALRLEYLTVAWNLFEGLIAVVAAAMAGSVALMGFGIDSFIESASAGVMIWRLRSENDRLERPAQRLVGASLFLLAGYIVADSAWTLWTRERPHPSAVGIVLTVISLFVMIWLARAKRRAAAALESRALEADAFQATACWWLSLSALSGMALNAAFGWWWADPVAALIMTFFIGREGLEAWRGEDHCADC